MFPSYEYTRLLEKTTWVQMGAHFFTCLHRPQSILMGFKQTIPHARDKSQENEKSGALHHFCV